MIRPASPTSQVDQLEQTFHKTLRIKSPSSSPIISRRQSISIDASPQEQLGITKKIAPNKKFTGTPSPAPRLLKSKKSASYTSVTDLNKDHPKTLPWFVSSNMPEYNCVTPQTVSMLLDGEFDSIVDEYYIIDCRFRYEYSGGHIRNAINMPMPEDVKYFLNNYQPNKKVIIIFHCEFSSKRGPTALKYLRKLDRIANWERWPELSYPELYLLAGGYNLFFREKLDYCEPKNYISMFDKNHIETCQLEMKERKRKSLHRSISFSGPFGRNKVEDLQNENDTENICRTITQKENTTPSHIFSLEDEKENLPILTPKTSKNLFERQQNQKDFLLKHLTQNIPNPKKNLLNSFRLSASTSTLPDYKPKSLFGETHSLRGLKSLDEEECSSFS